MLLAPLSVDVLFTVSALVTTNVFDDEKQALGGAVFQTVAQFGSSLGLASTSFLKDHLPPHT